MKTSIRIGEFQCTILEGGSFRVDGGAMFGVVPRVLWEKRAQPDSHNRVELAVNSLLIEGGGRVVLVDPGIGKREMERFGRHYAIQPEGGVNRGLENMGLTPDAVDLVINTHLHWDHSGADLVPLPGGGAVPAYPNALYLVQQGEWESACHPDEITRASYLFQDDTTLLRTGRLEVLHGDCEIVPGIRVIRTPGHTPYHQSVLVESGGEALLYLGDLIPTVSHLPLPDITALDLEPSRTLSTKKRILRSAGEKGWFLAFCHEKEKKILAGRGTDP